jgi:hypothetical protein
MQQIERVDAQIKDSVIEKIAQTYLADTIEDDYSLKYKKLKRSVHIVTYSILGILAALMAAFIISAQRVNIAITVTELDKPTQIQALEHSLLQQYDSKIDLTKERVLLSTRPLAKKATMILNFKKPVNFSNGVFLLRTKALKDSSRLKLILRDDSYKSNVRNQGYVVVKKQKGFSEVVLEPGNAGSSVNMDRIQQVRLELEPVLENSQTKVAILIKEFSFLTQAGRK